MTACAVRVRQPAAALMTVLRVTLTIRSIRLVVRSLWGQLVTWATEFLSDVLVDVPVTLKWNVRRVQVGS